MVVARNPLISEEKDTLYKIMDILFDNSIQIHHDFYILYDASPSRFVSINIYIHVDIEII